MHKVCVANRPQLISFIGVVSTTVNVLCELVRRDPQDYLSLAPQLFLLLTTSSNNWMLIKIIKLVSFVHVDVTVSF